jgi:hypothetical protein
MRIARYHAVYCTALPVAACDDKFDFKARAPALPCMCRQEHGRGPGMPHMTRWQPCASWHMGPMQRRALGMTALGWSCCLWSQQNTLYAGGPECLNNGQLGADVQRASRPGAWHHPGKTGGGAGSARHVRATRTARQSVLQPARRGAQNAVCSPLLLQGYPAAQGGASCIRSQSWLIHGCISFFLTS